MFFEKSADPSTNGIQNPAYLTVEKPVNKFLEVTKVRLHMYPLTYRGYYHIRVYHLVLK